MADSVYAPPKAHLGSGQTALAHPFYVVSPLKAMILMLGTVGGYALYWHYQNWLMFKQDAQNRQSEDADIIPVVRTIFALFYTHALMSEVETHRNATGRAATGNSGTSATAIVLITIVSYILSFFPQTSSYYVPATVVSLVLVVPLTFAYRAAQKYINASCGDPQGASNARFTAANIVWLLIGIGLWILVISGLFVGDPATAAAAAE